ncbi:MAG: hypothetical protein QXO71_10845, partial [Candidatus Jordarchaeaceae archaeon]
MAVIHFIAVGGAGMDFHLAGIPRFGADEVVLVSHPESSILPQIIESLKNFGVEYRQIIVKEAEYLDTLRKTNEEAA